MDRRTEHIQARLTERERALFERLVENNPCYLEFGCGGSTEIAVALGCKLIVSVDSDPNWIEALKKKEAIAAAIERRALFFEHVDIGSVGAWGAPTDDSKIRHWPRYYLTPFTKYDFLYNLIFIDGRFRNACASAAYCFMADDALVAVHDYTVRHSYYDMEKFFEIKEQADTMVVFKKKKNITMQSFFASFSTYMLAP